MRYEHLHDDDNAQCFRADEQTSQRLPRQKRKSNAESESSKASNSRRNSAVTTCAHAVAVSGSDVVAYDRGVCDGVNRDDYS